MSKENNRSILKRIAGIRKTDFAVLIVGVLIYSLFYSFYALSITMISLAVIAVFDISATHALPVRFSKGLMSFASLSRKNPSFPVTTILFFIVLIAGMWSSDEVYWLERVRIKLPYLILPLAWMMIPKLSSRQFVLINYLLLVVTTYACLRVGWNYLMNFEAINEGIKMGQAIPTPISHIRFSLMVALSIVCGILLLVHKMVLQKTVERWFVLVVVIFLFIFIHILSVRSGLVVLYGVVGIMVIARVFIERKWLPGIALLVVIAAVPFIAYLTIPSLYNKVNYALWDLKMYGEGRGEAYSDSERLQSLKIGWEVAKDNLIFGAGSGDVRSKMFEKYDNLLPRQNHYKMPHNQYLSVLAGMGLMGLIAFLYAFFFPLSEKRHRHNGWVVCLVVMIALSFLFENTIESARGVAVHMAFLGVFMNCFMIEEGR